MRVLFPIIVIVPAIEIALFLLSGKLIGVGFTFLFILITGFLGAYFAKKQGLEVIRNARFQMTSGQMPHDILIDGICILVGGLFLLTPGFFTDIIGFCLVLPFTRKLIKPFLKKWITKWINQNTITIIR
ncbi:FxsA family protein [Bacillus kwashiorkori]|uniref:FxsA family protein n=1 Tax=Bacillus kwashiorkori TaxID=1522318 RepID=UPI000780BC5C|nr:FxsA family protein [Bacillus kwashiorkori]